MVRRHHAATVAVVVGFAIARQAEGEGRPFRFEELSKVQRVGAFDVSPDGKWVVYAAGTPLVAENRTTSALWVAPAAGGSPRSLTSGGKRDSDPRFSPDGRRVAFLSNRDGGSQIWTVAPGGGEPTKATSFPTGVNGFRWSPDGKWFLITSDVFPECTDVACLEGRVRGEGDERLRRRHAGSGEGDAREGLVHAHRVHVGRVHDAHAVVLEEPCRVERAGVAHRAVEDRVEGRAVRLEPEDEVAVSDWGER